MMRCLLLLMFLTGCSSAKQDLKDAEIYTPLIDPRDVRALFLGDSITVNWKTASANRNAGIAGQNSEMIGRRAGVEIAAGSPRYIHILAGTNDDVRSPSITVSNIRSMVLTAQGRARHVIVGTVPPMDAKLFWQAPYIKDLNAAIVAEVKTLGAVIADYHARMVLPDGSQNSSLFMDGIHPNEAGYRVMNRVLREARREARVLHRAARAEFRASKVMTPRRIELQAERQAARQEKREARQEARAEKRANR